MRRDAMEQDEEGRMRLEKEDRRITQRLAEEVEKMI